MRTGGESTGFVKKRRFPRVFLTTALLAAVLVSVPARGGESAYIGGMFLLGAGVPSLGLNINSVIYLKQGRGPEKARLVIGSLSLLFGSGLGAGGGLCLYMGAQGPGDITVVVTQFTLGAATFGLGIADLIGFDWNDYFEKMKYRRWRSTLSFVFGSLAAAGAVSTGIAAYAITKDIKASCGGVVCEDKTSSDFRRAKNLAITTDVLAGAAILGAVAGTVLYLEEPGMWPKKNASVSVLPTAAPGCVGLSVVGEF